MSDLVYIADVVKCVIRINIIYKKVPSISHVCGGISVVCISSGSADVSVTYCNEQFSSSASSERISFKRKFRVVVPQLALTFCFHDSTKLLPFCTITQNGNKIINRSGKIST